MLQFASFHQWQCGKKSPIPLFLHPTFLFHLLAFSMQITFINHPHSMIFPCYFHGMFLTKFSIPWRKGCKMHVVWQLIDLLTWFFHTKKQWRKCEKDASADLSGYEHYFISVLKNHDDGFASWSSTEQHLLIELHLTFYLAGLTC